MFDLTNPSEQEGLPPFRARERRACCGTLGRGATMKKAASHLLSILGGLGLMLLTLIVPAILILAVFIALIMFFAR